MMKRQAVITGLGIVSPIGIGIDAFWDSALAGRSGIDELTQFDTSRLPSDYRIGGEVRNFKANDWMGGMFGRMAGRFTHFATAACRMACQDSALQEANIPSDGIKVAIGSAIGGLVHVHEPSFTAFLRGERVVPWIPLEYPIHAATSHVTAEAQVIGQNITFSTGCCAGVDAISWATDEIRRGTATAAIAGGTEAPISEYCIMAFHASGALATWGGPAAKASRPFDRRRSGLVLAEGAAIVVIENEEHALARGAKVYARILGVGAASEGGELRAVEPSGTAAARAMTSAIRQAGLTAVEIDYICAHGNSMVNYDAAETAAIKIALGAHAWNVPISSIKSMCGHALGAAGPMQVVTACLVLRDGIVSPTINYEEQDPGCDLDYVPNVARRVRARNVLVHVHSVGGTHMAVVLGTPR